jgi:C4-dicarboxylate-specific signal transduction histidine kinase|tara:strand:- start:460 stop:672 length:213 start_codon:yes stop_codon:yes gene_type:complete
MILLLLRGGRKMTENELTKLVEQQQDTITHLTRRMSSLTDELAVFKGDIETFRGNVANDIHRLIEMIRNK